MGDTSIEWTDKTWNPVRGCSRVSPGCENCYAEQVARRFSGPGKPYHGLADRRGWTREVRLVPEHLDDPLRWRKPRRVFVNSMSDLFHEKLDGPTVARVFAVMARASRHTFQVLTKRAARMRQMLTDEAFWHEVGLGVVLAESERVLDTWPLPNVWLGVSVEDQRRADERIPELLATPAAVRFVSCEPLLGPVTLWSNDEGVLRGPGVVVSGGMTPNTVHGWPEGYDSQPGIDWVIVGGESGGGARPFHIDWARSLVRQCQRAGVAVFVKQLGAVPTGEWGSGGRLPMLDDHPSRPRAWLLRDRKGGDPAEWPEDLRVREFPEVRP